MIGARKFGRSGLAGLGAGLTAILSAAAMPSPGPVFTPDQEVGLTHAWRAPDAVVSGTDINSIPGAFGTAVSLTGAGTSKPQLQVGAGPKGSTIVSHNVGGSQHFTFPQMSAGSKHIFISIRAGSTGNNNRYVFGQTSSNATNLIRWRNATNPTPGFDMIASGNTAGSASFAGSDTLELAKADMRIAELVWDQPNNRVRVGLDGALGDWVTLASPGDFTFSTIGRAGAAHSTMQWGEIFIYDHIVADDVRARVVSYMRPYLSDERFYSASAGIDAVDRGWSESSPLATLAYATNSMPVRPGMKLRHRGGDVYPAFVMDNGGQAGREVQYGPAWGGGKGRIRGGSDYPATWTDTGAASGSTDHVWTIEDLNKPPAIVWCPDGSEVAEAVAIADESKNRRTAEDAGLTAAFRWAYAGTTLGLRLPAGLSPNVGTVRRCAASIGITANANRSHLRAVDWDVRYHGFGLRAYSPFQAFDRVSVVACWNDGFAPSNTPGIDITNFSICWVGEWPRRDSQGDGISYHGGSGGLIANGLIRGCSFGGIRNEGATVVTVRDVIVEDNGNDIEHLPQAGSGGGMDLERVTVNVTARSVTGKAATFFAAGTGSLTAKDSVFNRLAGASSSAFDMQAGTIFEDLGGNTVSGFNTLA